MPIVLMPFRRVHLALYGRKELPRRAYRGLSLFEAVLSLLVFVLVSNTGIEIVRSATIAQQHRVETARIAAMADLGERYVRRDLQGMLFDLSSQPNRLRQLTEAELRDAGLLLEGARLAPILKRELELWLYAPTASEVIVIARIFGETDRPNIPGSVVGVGEIGWVSPLKPTYVQGAGLDWDVSALQASANMPQVGDLVAVRYLNTTADLRPYLHRAPLNIGGVAYNGMEGPLDMGGFEISNAGDIAATGLVTGEVVASSLTVSNTLDAGQLNVDQTATIGGQIAARDGTFSGPVTAQALDATGTLSATRLTIAGPIEAASAQISGVITGGSLNAASSIAANSILTGVLSTSSVTAASAQAGTGIIEGNLQAATGTFQSITTGSCSGC